MVQDDNQLESLETLKLINAASTALRLYPEDSVKVRESIETAYQGTKTFLRKNNLLRFSFLDGEYFLNGSPVSKRMREQFKMLTFRDQLQKMELNEFVLSTGIDRKKFKKILSVFKATPEQISKAGGSKVFIEQLELAEIFPEQYFGPGETEKEIHQKQKVNGILKQLSGGVVQSPFILYLVGRTKENAIEQALVEEFKSTENSAHIVATTTYSLLQILFKDHTIAISPVFSEMLANVSSHIAEDRHVEVSTRAASLLAPYLDQCVILMLSCQDFSSSFGELFYEALLVAADNDTLARVLGWMQEQQKLDGKLNDKLVKQLEAVAKGYEALAATPRGKQVLAMMETKGVLQETEKNRKGTRVQSGISALAKGDLTILANKEVCLSLPATIEKLLKNDKEVVAAAIIQNVVKGLKEKDNGLRLSLGKVIGAIATKLAAMNRWEWLEKLAPISLAWIREYEVADQSLKQHLLAMQAMMNQAWYSGKNDLAEEILDVFYFVRSGAFEKNDEVRQLVGNVQDKNVDVVLLREYLDRCFVRPVNEVICRKIVMQGPVAVRFLIDTLIASDKRADRIRLLKVLIEYGSDLVPLLLERLSEPMPWFGKRNLIRLLSETGTEENIEAVLNYARHEDLRVQQELLQCIVRIGGGSTREYLLQILPITSEQAKVQIVKNLRRLADMSIVEPLSELLKECRVYQGPVKDALVLEIAKTLGASGSAKAFHTLREIIDGGAGQFGKESVRAAELAISFIHEQGRIDDGSPDEGQPEQDANENVVASEATHTSETYEAITDSDEEKEVYALLQKNEVDSAKKALLWLIEKTALLKKFNEAEALRSRLIEIDGMALTEIIKAAEIIEDAKSNSVDQDHVLIWADLYDLLSTSEFNAFYLALEHDTYPTDTDVVKQGDSQEYLFFVNKGRMKLYFNEGERETLVKTIGHGKVLGGGSFFDDSIWTINATSMGSVEVSTLSKKAMDDWREEFPALEKKIQDYCLRSDRLSDFFTSSGAERRVHTRYPMDRAIYITLLDNTEQLTDTIIHGDSSDVSIGGLSFLSRITQREQARTLLGRHVRIFFKDKNGEGVETDISGTVKAIHNLTSVQLGRSVHIEFDRIIESDKVTGFINGT